MFLLGCLPSKTDATVLLIVTVLSLANSSSCKTPPFFLSLTNRTALRNFPLRKRLENVWWRSSIVWAQQDFPRYPMVELYVSFTSLSNAPRFHKSSRKKMRFQICAELLTPWARWRITDWKMITLSAFHFLAGTPSSSTYRITTTIFSWLSRKVRHSFGLA